VEPRRVSLERILAAREVVDPFVHRTPILSSRAAAEMLRRANGVRVADDRIHLKAEHLQKTGSFKPRGMVNRVRGLTAAERAAGIVTVSAGNAAQAYAYAARAAGVQATVVMPARAVRSKVEAATEYGAEVILTGAHFGETYEAMLEIAATRGLTICHPYDDPEVIAGHGTAGLEILEDLPDVDVVVVGVGGGGLIAGIAEAVKALKPEVRIFGVEPVTSNAVALAVERGTTVPITPASVADGLNAPFAGAWTAPICAALLESIILVEDSVILGGVRFAVERLKQVLEPAGAAALAAVIYGRVPIRPGERALVVLSGGNVEVSRLGELVAGAAPLPA
jgi:threonine dehydratase